MIWFLLAGVFLLGAGCAALAIWFVQVRNLPGHGAHTGPMLALTSDVPPAAVAATSWRQPEGVENLPVPGGAPGDGMAWPGRPEPGDVPPHPRFGPLLADTPPEGRPLMMPGAAFRVGRHEHTVPRVRADLPVAPARDGHPPWTGEIPAVPDPWNSDHPGWDPGDGLDRAPVVTRFARTRIPNGYTPPARPLGVADLGPADALDRTPAERTMP